MRRRVSVLALAGLAAAVLSGCGSIIPLQYPETVRSQQLASDELLVVGRIELLPPLQPGEQKLRLGDIDPFDMRGKIHERAVLFLDTQATDERQPSGRYINPRLGDWFVFVVKREHRHISDALIYMEYEPLLYGKRQAAVNTAQLRLPAPLSLDIQAQDKAVYIGTWRIMRDEFHTVTNASVLNDVAGARAALIRLHGSDPGLRSAIPKAWRERIR